MTVNIDAADGADGWFEHSVSFHVHLIGSSHRRGLDKSLVEDALIAGKTMTRYDTGSKTDIRRVRSKQSSTGSALSAFSRSPASSGLRPASFTLLALHTQTSSRFVHAMASLTCEVNKVE